MAPSAVASIARQIAFADTAVQVRALHMEIRDHPELSDDERRGLRFHLSMRLAILKRCGLVSGDPVPALV